MVTKDTRIVDLTVEQLKILISETVEANLSQQANSKPVNFQKKFFSPKEFSHSTGMPYSTVVYRCKVGKLKARQDEEGCSWQIDSSELERYKSEANDNIN